MTRLAIGERRIGGQGPGGRRRLILSNLKGRRRTTWPATPHLRAWLSLPNRLPGAVWSTAGRAACGLGLAANIDGVGVGPAKRAALSVGLAGHDLAAMLIGGIVPGCGGARLTIFERLVLSRSRHLTVALVHLPADLVAENAPRHRTDGSAGDTAASVAADRGTGSAAGDRADDRSGALLVAWPAGRQHS